MLRTLSLADPLGDFIVPGLENVPTPNKDRTEPTVPSILRLSLQSCTELDTHVEAVRLDVRKYNYSRSSQAAAMLLLANLDLYIPTENERNIQSSSAPQKFPNQNKEQRVKMRRSTGSGQSAYINGRFAAAEGKWQIPWENVGCLSYAHTLYDDGNKARFELVISTPQQKEATWKYGHQKQVFMDLTFGFSSSRVLLAILLAVDDNKRGVPLGFLLFSARKDAKAVHADYNGELLTHLLE
ncbi:hypothetical protein ARMGADRAFT_1039860 [Armillaria gallica]|uniref:MULE transposase domain-containing protein n=1 Tax=Armillaria gallica TaxID=47427 RepID=A0A2H3CZI7_ARMGA|nr:hypothetical protein ARMGADRAFT_1039860 [Armillaria gallica]